MNNSILNWNGTDHNAIYTRQLTENPLYYAPELKLWATYSYEYCKAVFLNNDANVPGPVIGDNSPLNDKARLLIRKMARISNNAQHTNSREAAMIIYQKISAIQVGQVLEALLQGINTKDGFDWVDVIGKHLPIHLILKGLNFDAEDSAYIASNIEPMTRIMLPNKTAEDIKMINAVTGRFYEISEKNIISAGISTKKETIELLACNLTGLFIQSYEGGWGLLCNTLLALALQLKMGQVNRYDSSYCTKLVNETLRWDPPVHNSRRVVARDIFIGGQTIKAGETILIVLAAANLDGSVFKNPLKFDLTRANNGQHLTFGLGGHNCVAKHFNIGMAADVCHYLLNRYKNIHLLQKEFNYGPKLNVRLVEQLMISFS